MAGGPGLVCFVASGRFSGIVARWRDSAPAETNGPVCFRLRRDCRSYGPGEFVALAAYRDDSPEEQTVCSGAQLFIATIGRTNRPLAYARGSRSGSTVSAARSIISRLVR